MTEPADDDDTPDRRIRLLLVEDHQMVLDSMREALAVRDPVTVVGSASSLASARRLLAAVPVDVVVTDLHLGDGLGTELVAACEPLRPRPKVVVITGTDERSAVAEALATGCAGLVSKAQGMDRLLDAILAIARGASVFPAEFLRRAVRGDDERFSLSDRELEILHELAAARSAKEIAASLFLSEHTVRNHIAQVLGKLGARNQLEAVVIAARNGLVTIV